MKNRYILWSTLVVAGLALALTGCGSGSSDNTNMGTLRVGITDQGLEELHSVILAIREIRVVQAGNENQSTPGLPRIVTFATPRVVDIMQLQYQQLLLGEAVIPSGNYSQVRLVLAPNVAGQDPVNYVTYTADPTQKVALQTPSGQQSGLKVLGQFVVEAGQINTIVLDFVPTRAIVQAGAALNLKPTGIRITQTAAILQTFGALTGTVSPESTYSTAVVSLIPEGQRQPIAKGTVNPDTGEFRALLPQGTYYLRIEALGYQAYNGSMILPPQTFTVNMAQDTAIGVFTLTAN
jgi:hypothetical protein